MDKLKSNIQQALQSSSLFTNTQNWYSHLSPRDQTITKALAALMALVLVYTWIWVPSAEGKIKAQKRYQSEMNFHETMKENAHLFKSGAAKTGTTGGSILSIVNSTAKAKGVQLSRFEPDGDGGLRIWLDKASFDKAIDWLELLELERGIKVEQISMDKVNQGIANVRATLQR